MPLDPYILDLKKYVHAVIVHAVIIVKYVHTDFKSDLLNVQPISDVTGTSYS